MTETTKVTIEYGYSLWGTRVYRVWVRGGYFESSTAYRVGVILTDLGLQAGKRADVICREARVTGRVEFEAWPRKRR